MPSAWQNRFYFKNENQLRPLQESQQGSKAPRSHTDSRSVKYTAPRSMMLLRFKKTIFAPEYVYTNNR
jgi:hypothetical protein